MSVVSHLKLEATWIFFWNNELLCFNLDELFNGCSIFSWGVKQRSVSRVMLFRAILAGGGGAEERKGGGGGAGAAWEFEGVAWEEMVACSRREILRFGLPGQWLFLRFPQDIFSK